MLDVKLMGPPQITVDGDPLQVDTRKAIALLAYLAVEGSATRQTLAALLWADAPDERARATLRRTLSALRTGVGDVVTADRDQVRISRDPSVDLTAFEATVAETSTHGHDPQDVCGACVPLLDRAVGLHRGDFLAGFSVRDAPEFEDWARTVAEGLRLRVGEAFNRLAHALAASGDYEKATTVVARWLSLDELHEPAHRLSMLLHAWAGDRPGAIEAYRRCVAVLDRELGVPPLEETTELYEAIIDEDLPPPPALRRRVRAVPVAAVGSDDLLDRREEMDALQSAFALAEAEGAVWHLTGPSWVGKTRVVEELGRLLDGQGSPILIGRASAMEATLTYGVAVQILTQAVEHLDARVDQLPPWVLGELSRIIPQLGSPGEGPVDPFGEIRLMEAVFSLVQSVATRPVLIVVDDAHWTDPASARLLSYLGKRIDSVTVLLLVITREGETIDPVIGALIGDAHRIRVLPLEASQIAEQAGATRAQEIIDSTGGLPLLVLEALSGRPPEREVARYLESRTRELGDLARQVLAAASILGGVTDPALLREVSGRSDEEVVLAVEELTSAGLLRETAESDGYAFPIDTLEKTTYESLSLARRRLLHRRAADSMATRSMAHTDPTTAAAIARHMFEGGDPRAGEWSRIAGDLARRVYAHDTARRFYETALAMGVDDAGSVHLALGELAIATGSYSIALRELTAAAALSRGDVLGIVEHRMGELHRLLGRFDLAVEHFKRAEPIHPVPAEVLTDWALLSHRQGDDGAASVLASRALDSATGSGDPLLISRAESVMGVVGTGEEALSHLEHALVLAGDDDLARMRVLNNQARLLSTLGEEERALQQVQDAISIAARTGYRHREAALRNHLADLHHRAGRREEAEAELRRAVELFADVAAGSWEPEVWLLSRW